jgi:hypothetical protein
MTAVIVGICMRKHGIPIANSLENYWKNKMAFWPLLATLLSAVIVGICIEKE